MALPELGEKIRITQQRKMTDDWWVCSHIIARQMRLLLCFWNTHEGLSLGASPLLMFTILEKLKKEGYSYFDWCAINLPRLPTSSYLWKQSRAVFRSVLRAKVAQDA